MAAAVSAEHEEAKNTLPEEQSASLVDVLEQIDVPARDALVDELARPPCSIGSFRLTCCALRSLTDTSVRVSRPLALHLGAGGAVCEPLAALARWGCLRDTELVIYFPEAGLEAFLPAITELPEAVRCSVARMALRAPNMGASHPTVPGPAVGSLALLLPCLRSLDLSGLPAGWSPGESGEGYTALASLGTLEELELPGVPALLGIQALAGSLRRLTLLSKDMFDGLITPSAVAPIGQLTRLEALTLAACFLDVGEGPTFPALLSLLPLSLTTLELQGGLAFRRVGQTFTGTCTLSRGYLKALDFSASTCSNAAQLAALARDELLPRLAPGGRLESLTLERAWADGWDASDMAPLLELWRRSDQARAKVLHVKARGRATDICSAIAALQQVDALSLDLLLLARTMHVELPLQPPSTPSSGSPAPAVDLPPPEEVLRMALQRLVPPSGCEEAGAEAGAEEDGAVSRVLLLRGPAASALLEQPSYEAVKAWAEDLSRQAAAAAGAALRGPRLLVRAVIIAPPAGAVLVRCSDDEAGAAEAVAGAVAALGDGSEAVRARRPPRYAKATPHEALSDVWAWAVRKVIEELWAASGGGGEGQGPSLQRRVEWALGVQEALRVQPRFFGGLDAVDVD